MRRWHAFGLCVRCAPILRAACLWREEAYLRVLFKRRGWKAHVIAGPHKPSLA